MSLGESLLALVDSHREFPYVSIEYVEAEAMRLCGLEVMKSADKEPWKLHVVSNDADG